MNGETKKNIRKLFWAGIVGLAILAGHPKDAGATLVDSNSIVQDGIEYYIQTDKSLYTLGEDVEMLYKVTNLRDEDVTFSFHYSPEWNFWVEREGQSVWRAVNGWYAMGSQFTLIPGESKEFPVYSPPYIWDMQDSKNNLVDIGEYNVIGGLDDGKGEYDSTGVSVRIEIVPEPTSIALLGLGLVCIIFRKGRYKHK